MLVDGCEFERSALQVPHALAAKNGSIPVEMQKLQGLWQTQHDRQLMGEIIGASMIWDQEFNHDKSVFKVVSKGTYQMELMGSLHKATYEAGGAWLLEMERWRGARVCLCSTEMHALSTLVPMFFVLTRLAFRLCYHGQLPGKRGDMLSKLGSAAGIVLKDIEGNLKKAQVVYKEAPEARQTFSGYLKASSVEGVTWLLRGVEFFMTMINLMFTEEKKGNAGVEEEAWSKHGEWEEEAWAQHVINDELLHAKQRKKSGSQLAGVKAGMTKHLAPVKQTTKGSQYKLKATTSWLRNQEDCEQLSRSTTSAPAYFSESNCRRVARTTVAAEMQMTVTEPRTLRSDLEAYKQTLMQYHGWARVSAFSEGIIKSEGLIIGDVPAAQRTKLCERDAPAGAMGFSGCAFLWRVRWMVELMKKEGIQVRRPVLFWLLDLRASPSRGVIQTVVAELREGCSQAPQVFGSASPAAEVVVSPAPKPTSGSPEAASAASPATTVPVDAVSSSASADVDATPQAVEAADVQPVVHETRFGLLLEKFRACELRDESGALTDIDMAKFFEACELYRDMLSKLGSAAGFVLKDIEGNLKKAQVVYKEAPEARQTFSGYLKASSVEGVTWLLRGVEFFMTMIKLMFTDEKGNAGVEAYKQTLMQYHGWMLQKTVKLGMRAMPGKDGIVKSEGLVPGRVITVQQLVRYPSKATCRPSKGQSFASATRQRPPLQGAVDGGADEEGREMGCQESVIPSGFGSLFLVATCPLRRVVMDQSIKALHRVAEKSAKFRIQCAHPLSSLCDCTLRSQPALPTMGNCQATEVPSAEEVVVKTPPKSNDQEETSTRSPAPSMEVDSTPAPEIYDAPVPEVGAAAGDATASAPAEAEAPAEPAAEAEVKPVVHETRFGILVEKFNACKIRDASGTITDIDMPKFFEACDLYRSLDITSNLKKAQVVYEEAPADRATFSGYLKGGSVVGCTWLLRGVDFFLTMIYLMFTSNTGSPGVEAYKQTLMQYHGWMLQKTVKLGMRAMPGKDKIVQSEGMILGAVSPEQRTKLCERDAPDASSAGLEVVHWMVELMKKEGKWDTKKA
ncbi:Pleckstrin-likey domain-containing family A member 8 [Symbiodinium microadriaticum]|uniref:Pleckstrin-likey domain-containing family A member 8 n=1 Tax=Symbiodinium microadriaticum TaxID=2951 RepID=A0A1Q9D6S1_SYMMI|nr:Pleckstrin-likey domain-containing family A member 8 [Symbiodinium microadriaticum]